ncbi:MAG: hypothetical protein UT08_C0018G0036 [Candidatus Woesebacteria bacterium GW2011_GWB1_38_8]|uniref:Aspartyl protease n=1 Tax=Candidatus Woesebacteria bacterium GW2011_GWB1_38_8 TaxID=1618570 RepID=A0A0G0L991_9BACT|nr:MAG: hypothetical protein UT08_C0018G0036 [Candidatus Woesebacteria bacterium GW2011_GWB1_38_8]
MGITAIQTTITNLKGNKKVTGEFLVDTVVIGQKDDSPLLGVITLEGMGLMVDPFSRKLRPMRLMLA